MYQFGVAYAALFDWYQARTARFFFLSAGIAVAIAVIAYAANRGDTAIMIAFIGVCFVINGLARAYERRLAAQATAQRFIYAPAHKHARNNKR